MATSQGANQPQALCSGISRIFQQATGAVLMLSAGRRRSASASRSLRPNLQATKQNPAKSAKAGRMDKTGDPAGRGKKGKRIDPKTRRRASMKRSQFRRPNHQMGCETKGKCERERECVAGGEKKGRKRAKQSSRRKKGGEMHNTWISKDRHRTTTSISASNAMLQTRKRDTDTFQSAPKREEKSV